jgi:acyl-CoA thioester hydrolase
MGHITKTKIIVRSTDCDSDRIINNHRYFTYMEQGRLHHLGNLGVMPSGQRQPGQATRPVTLAEMSCRFLTAGNYPDTFILLTKTKEVRNRSFSLSYQLTREEDGTILVEGDSVQVWLDDNGRPTPPPEEIKELMIRSCDEAILDVAPEPSSGLMANNPVITETPLIVRYSDLDSNVIVNSAEYFVFFEQGRLHHMREIGVLPRGQSSSHGEAERPFTIAETRSRFRAPGLYPDELVVRTSTEEVRNRSFVFNYRVLRTEGTLLAEGSSVQVWLDDDGNPIEIPGGIRASLVSSLSNERPAIG